MGGKIFWVCKHFLLQETTTCLQTVYKAYFDQSHAWAPIKNMDLENAGVDMPDFSTQ